MGWRGFLGVAVLLAVGLIFSRDRRAIDKRLVVAALAIQVGIGALALFVPWGRKVFALMASGVEAVLGYGQNGAAFLFGGLVGPRMDTLFGGSGYIFALRVLPAIIYVSALMGVLYHWRVMQVLAQVVGGALRRVLGTSTLESFSAVLTIFLGQSEMPVALRPYLHELTDAELFTIMCSGSASIAGSVLVAYAALGIPMPYLLAASFMAIPGGLLFAKILWPTPREAKATPMPRPEMHTSNLFDAIAEGAMSGVRVAVAVGAMLIAFVGLIALLDGFLQAIGTHMGLGGLSLQRLLGLLLSPVAWLIGVPASECIEAAGFLGQKLAFNEFVAYVNLVPVMQAHALSRHTIGILSFALCGFSNFSSIGILIGAFGSIVPERRAFIARVATRCVLAGSLSNAMSAAIAGIFLA